MRFSLRTKIYAFLRFKAEKPLKGISSRLKDFLLYSLHWSVIKNRSNLTGEINAILSSRYIAPGFFQWIASSPKNITITQEKMERTLSDVTQWHRTTNDIIREKLGH
ncbi:hypothetical protein WA026_017530 [Henosepilachna vigintioctopunctata]|uniref:Uncharacterized protein n=1 Tax=Henosepilachna vigintioctopunctata TaxID=420089 RepID=A0AAW1V1G1_9CUCU